MARQQLGPAPTNGPDAVRKTDLDTAISGVSGSSGGGVPVADNGDDTFTISSSTANGAVSVGTTNGLAGQRGLWIQTDASGNIVTFWVDTTGTSPYTVWSNAITNRGTTRARWVAIGDSITEGQGASTRANRWIDKAVLSLRNNKPTNNNTGVGYLPSYYANYAPWNAAHYGNSTGTISNIDYVGSLGMRVISMAAGAQRDYYFTGTDIDILYTNVNGGQFTWAIDGGAATTVTTGSTYASTGIVNVTGLTSGNHTVTIKSVNNTFYFAGIVVFNNDRNAGIHLLDGGHFGHFVNSYVSDNGIMTSFAQELNVVQPDMLTIMFGTNEYTQGTSVANFQSQYTTFVNAMKNLTKVPSIMLIVPYQVGDASVTNRVDSWANYVAAIKNVANATGVQFLDLSAQMPVTTKSGTGYYDTDGIHPNDNGHNYIANAVVSAMGV